MSQQSVETQKRLYLKNGRKTKSGSKRGNYFIGARKIARENKLVAFLLFYWQ